MKTQKPTPSPTSKRRTQPKRSTNKKKTPDGTAPNTNRVEFPEVQGKILERVDLQIEPDEESYLELRFEDQTALVFIIQQYAGITITPDYGSWKTRNWRPIKSWPPFF